MSDQLAIDSRNVGFDNDMSIERLRSSLVGDVLVPGEQGYDEARAVWNAMIDRRPYLIAQCNGAADVSHAIAFARDHHLPVSIRAAPTTSPDMRSRTAA